MDQYIQPLVEALQFNVEEEVHTRILGHTHTHTHTHIQ